MDFLSGWRVKERKRIDYLGLLAALQLLMLLLFVFCFLGFSFLAMQVKEGMKIHDLHRLPVMLLSFFFSSPIYWQVEKKKKIASASFSFSSDATFVVLRILLKQNTILLSHVRVCVSHRRDISSFLDILIV